MPHVDSSLLESAAGLDSLQLAILFLGLMTLGVIWLAYLLVRYLGRKK
jgi:hypothetical protein